MSRLWFPQWRNAAPVDFARTLLSSLPGTVDEGRLVVPTLTREQLSRLGALERFEPRSLEFTQVPGDARWWIETLGPLVESVSFQTPSFPARRGWDWPLDIALLGGKASWIERANLSSLRRFVSLESATSLIELLLLPHTLEQALAQPIPEQLPPIHSLVVLAGAQNEQGETALLDALRSRWRADAAALVNVSEAKRQAWLGALTAQLSHDHPLDRSLWRACREIDAPRPLCLGRPSAFSNASLRKHVLRALPKMAAASRAPELGGGFRDLLHNASTDPVGTFEREIVGASRFAELKASFDDAAPAPETNPERAVHADLEARRLAVQIRPRDGKGTAANVDFTEPADWVDGETHQLRVIVQDLTTPLATRPQPQSEPLMLPPTGPSSVAHFDVALPTTGVFTARVLVIELPARVLQTLVFRHDVADGASTLTDETTARPFDSLGGRRSEIPFALLHNQDATQEHLLASISNGQASVVPLGAFAKLATNLSKLLDSLADDQDVQPLGAGDNLKLLIKVANEGVQLRRQLETTWGLISAPRLQVISADPSQVLPLECCYDGVAPGLSAKLCKSALPRLKKGLASCTCSPSEDEICPFRFWGISRVIERHQARPAVSAKLNHAANAVVRGSGPERKLDLAGSVLWAMDEVVDKGAKGLRKKVAKTVSAKLRKGLVQVDDWKAWMKAASESPAIIAAVLHHDDQELALTFADEPRLAGQIDERFTGNAQWVVFLGCNTAGESASSFTPASTLMVGGVKVVVGSLALVIGRIGGKCATEIVLQLDAQRSSRKPMAVGEFMRSMRARLLAQSFTMALGVIALGDADFVIGKG